MPGLITHFNMESATCKMNNKRRNPKTIPGLNNEQEYSCAHCTYLTKNKPSLKAHLKIHSTRKPFACEMCSYRTVDKSNLKSHLKVHTGEKPHRCSHCDFGTTSRYYLKQHESIHTKINLFKCEICDVHFRYRSGFTHHMRKHTGEVKVLNCKLCSFQTTCASSLKGHVVRHSDEKPFACSMCPYRAKLKKCIARHVRQVHCGFKRINKKSDFLEVVPNECVMFNTVNSIVENSDIKVDIVPNERIVFNSVASNNFSSVDTSSYLDSLIKHETVSNECLVFNSSDYVIKEESNDLVYNENVVINATYVNGLPKPIKDVAKQEIFL